MSGPSREFKIVCRGSWLSRAQAEHLISRLRVYDNQATFSIVVKETAGDRDQQTVLQDMDGKDFFTREIQEFLNSGMADFAVHSLKDVSSELFFQDNHYAVISREDPRDAAIFNKDVLQRIATGKSIRIGTSSPRRSLMAVAFLKRALPTVNGHSALVEAVAIRGNVDTRLQKLQDGLYDGIIVAVAGLNRLLNYDQSSSTISALLGGKRVMILPLIECPPAPGQGAIVAETRPGNSRAIDLLRRLNHEDLQNGTHQERVMAARYGAGCHQQFGVIHVSTPHTSFTYGAGLSNEGKEFSIYQPHPDLRAAGKKIFSAGDHMRSFFRYTYSTGKLLPPTKAIFVGSQHALHDDSLMQQAQEKIIWAAGTKTWTLLAQKGLWIGGCADALGLEFIEGWFDGPLLSLQREDLSVVTDEASAHHWANEGWKSVGTYSVEIAKVAELEKQISSADIIFWTSFRQFSAYRSVLKPDVVHCCSTGRTTVLFQRAGIAPIVFAGIKGFNEWRSSNNTAI